MSDRLPLEGRRVLVAAPFERDAESLAELFSAHGVTSRTCSSLDELGAALGDDVGAVLVTEEALRGDLQAFAAGLAAQPPWSDIPLLVLHDRRRPGSGAGHSVLARVTEMATNVIMLERPLGGASLVSAVLSSMRSRQRQFEIRDRIEQMRIGAEVLEASQRRLDAIVNSIDQMIWSARPDGFHDYYNQRWYDYTGATPGSSDGDLWIELFHPDDRDRAWSIWRHSLATGEPYRIEFRLRHRADGYRWVLGRAIPERDATGKVSRWYGTCTDIQEIVEARDVMQRSGAELEAMVARRTAELEEAHEVLRQSQKMEAVGQLTGGIAHDFNNMLTGVIGGLDIVRRRIATGRTEGIERFMDAASNSAQRAAGLTARLLAFSRRQPLDARPVDVNALVASLHDLLTRTLTERVALRIVAGDGLPLAVADANQLENALLNLAINARDAMPDGGTLTIATTSTLERDSGPPGADGATGRFVSIAVSDTGVGMSADILDKVYEPFFTTKPIGQGTGLGLSMVYGFVRQSGGHIRIHSRVGEGTKVTLLLPATEAKPTTAEREAGVAPHGAGQSVLVVEDDEAVRLLVREVLGELGYHAIETPDATHAIDVLASTARIDLMISDVGLPGMNGRQLADVARTHRPHLPILFVTGYAENAAMRAGFLGTNMAMITKPFALDALARKVDEMLAGDARTAADPVPPQFIGAGT